MNVLILQPPLVQLNTPYPSGAYLSAFFKKVREFGQTNLFTESQALKNEKKSSAEPPFNPQTLEPVESVRWIDMSNLLYREIFCAAGLKKLFALTEQKTLTLAAAAEKSGDVETAFNLRRYVMQQDKWIARIGDIQSILCGGSGFPHASGREFCHEFVRSAHMPRGQRMERFFAALNGNPSADDARFLATLAVEDLCDYITAVYDSNFEPVRYAASLAESAVSFSDVEKALDSPVMNDFFTPLLERVLSPFAGGDYLVCVSVPFPGTLAGSLACARTVKRLFKDRALVLLGGGYVNTELRELAERDPGCALFSYVDFLVYDRGYGALLGLLERCKKTAAESGGVFTALKADSRRVLAGADENGFAAAEDFFTRTLVPDYTGIDFSQYPRMTDETNPMHRLWSDGAWLKAYLAHGCYWHRCFFCDTTLDYVKNFRAAQTETLFAGLAEQAEKTGVYGVHFVDEAAPPKALAQFALLNCRRAEKRLTFWGNIRFEKAFTRHTADLLAYGGLTGVTGGIEIAAGDGLKTVEKGIDVETLVSSCAAFKEAGILVHAYMIFGYWEETPQLLIDSMETLRQLFENGLLDSAFWHKFVLTRHSRLYGEWKSGLHQSLRPLPEQPGTKPRFAENDLRFAGEKESQKYAVPLDSALSSWMRGEKLRTPVQKWFPFSMPKPSIAPDFIARHIAAYEKKRGRETAECAEYFEKNQTAQNGEQVQSDRQNQNPKKRFYWLGGKPHVTQEKNGTALIRWLYMDEEFSAQTAAKHAADIANALYALRPEAGTGSCRDSALKLLLQAPFPASAFAGNGLIFIL